MLRRQVQVTRIHLLKGVSVDTTVVSPGPRRYLKGVYRAAGGRSLRVPHAVIAKRSHAVQSRIHRIPKTVQSGVA